MDFVSVHFLKQALWIIKIEMYIFVNTYSQLMLEWLTGEIVVHAEKKHYSCKCKDKIRSMKTELSQ